ncbi:MAG: cytochrome c [Actinobacteria bacterium]|nr:cytochrome c [Actinomycetota bacterium]
MSDLVHEDTAILRLTRRWQTMGVFVLFLLVVAFPVYLAVEKTRRAEALTAQDAALVSAGHQLWSLNCAACHCVNGEGVDAPALNSQEFLTGASDQQIHGIVAGGVPGTEMPAWWNEYGGPLTDQQIEDLVAYVRSWQKNAPSRPDWRTPGSGG